jgi:ribosomal protein S18 acetylase RimI-like enzyme
MIEFSKFDSEILGKRVGKTAVRRLNTEILDIIYAESEKMNLDIVFIRDSGYHFTDAHLMNWKRLQLADIKVVLTISDLDRSNDTGSSRFFVTQDIKSGDLEYLYLMVNQIASRSRFYRCFGKEAAETLYRTWLDNSIAKSAADYCFLAKDVQTNNPASLITIKSEGDTAELILVATGESYQGKGAGKLLVAHVFSFLKKNGFKNCSVGCQLDNRSALRFYNSVGFKFDSLIADFHLRCKNAALL